MEEGDVFPDFILPDENGELFDSKMLRGMRYIVYFYSKDGTSGCTTEANDFNEMYPKLILRNVPIFGVSKDSAESHRKFVDKNGLKLKLLSDTDHELMEKVGAWKDDKAVRSTFVIGKNGEIEAAWHNVKVDGHVEQVYDRVKTIMRL